MSFLGYGSQPDYTNGAPQAYSGFPGGGPTQAPVGAQMGFNPGVTTPWEQQYGQIGEQNVGKQRWNIFQGDTSYDKYVPVMGALPWDNPIAKNFGGANNLFGPSKDQIGANFNTPGGSGLTANPYADGTSSVQGGVYGQTPGFTPGFQGGQQPVPGSVGGPMANNPADMNGKNASLYAQGTDPTAPAQTPQNYEDLTKQIGSLSYEQLLSLDTSGGYKNWFKNAAQDYSNAYANQDYAKQAGQTQEYAQNHLQDAYGQLMQRMNQAGLL